MGKKYYRCKVEVDADVIKAYSIFNPVQIEHTIIIYLNDPDGWGKHGYFFEPVLDREDTSIRLVMPQTIFEKCGLPDNLSCAELGGRFMYLNASRWFGGSKESKLSLGDYRQYMVNHEIGHILGFDHKKCPCPGCKAPIMLQQTLGLQGCIPDHGNVR